MNIKRFTKGLIAATLLLCPALASAENPGSVGVGVYTAVMGKVTVNHPGEDRALSVKLHDEVLFKDVIQTEKESRTKAFFQDDSILTVGENSRVEITEYIYNPEANLRRSVVKVMEGQVRALVSKVFKSNGSRFEVHTPSAVAAARGTYFTVWHENGQSGIINVGESGRVDFTSGGVTVAVDPGQFSVAEHGNVPSLPAVYGFGLNESAQAGQAQVTKKDDHGPTLVDRHGEKKEGSHLASLSEASSSKDLARAKLAVESTTVQEARQVESPLQAAKAMHYDLHLANAYVTLDSPVGHHGGGHGGKGDNGDGNIVSENSRNWKSGPVGGMGAVVTATPAPLPAPTPASTMAPTPAPAPITTLTAAPVTPPAVFTDASDGRGHSDRGHSGSGNGYSHGHN